MTPEDYMRAVQAAKEAYEREKRETEEQLQRAQAKIAKLEKKLAVLHEHHLQKASQLLAAYMGVPGEQAAVVAPPAPRVGVARKRGEREEMVLNLVRGIALPDVTAKEIEEVWNRRYRNDPIKDSTVRSILERLEAKKLIHVSARGGGVGSGIPTRYSPGPPPEK